MNQETIKLYIDIIKQEVKPALGCTEPIAVALAVAKACENIGGKTERTIVEVSPNILKNGMGVGIPGTGMVGLKIAAALGVTCGKSEYGLEVVKDVNEHSVEEAKKMAKKGCVEINLADTTETLFVKATCYSKEHCSTVIIKERHDNIFYEEIDGVEQKVKPKKDASQEDASSKIINIKDANMTIKSILEFIKAVNYDDISFILKAAKLNKILSLEGLKKGYGLSVGKSIKMANDGYIFSDSLLTHAMILTASASDARMAGCTLPAMSNSGSGNQGITVTMPVLATAEKLRSNPEQLAKALALSHLIAIHIKSHLDRLSALCGCVVASSGASCGICYLMGGDYTEMCAALKNMIGNITGTVCDGAKVGCALKVTTGVSCAILSTNLAMNGICISSNDGIIEDDIEKTIQNLGTVGTKGMAETDRVMLDIMVHKCI